MNLEDLMMKLAPESDFDEEEMQVAMPLFCNGKRFNINRIVEHLKSFWKLEVKGVDRADDMAAFKAGGEQVAIIYMPEAIPREDLEELADAALLWPTAMEDLRGHDGHAVITVFKENKSTPLEQFQLLTKVVHSVLATSAAVGVYLSTQTVLHSKDIFMECAETMLEGQTPILLWVFFGPMADEKGNGIYTFGLRSFGHPDLEVVNSKTTRAELLILVTNLAMKIVTGEFDIKPGDVLQSPNNSVKIPVTLSNGVFVEGETLKLEV